MKSGLPLALANTSSFISVSGGQGSCSTQILFCTGGKTKTRVVRKCVKGHQPHGRGRESCGPAGPGPLALQAQGASSHELPCSITTRSTPSPRRLLLLLSDKTVRQSPFNSKVQKREEGREDTDIFLQGFSIFPGHREHMFCVIFQWP